MYKPSGFDVILKYHKFSTQVDFCGPYYNFFDGKHYLLKPLAVN